MYVRYVRTWGHKLKLNERIYGGARTFQICTHAKALMFRVKLTQWTPRYLSGSTKCDSWLCKMSEIYYQAQNTNSIHILYRLWTSVWKRKHFSQESITLTSTLSPFTVSGEHNGQMLECLTAASSIPCQRTLCLFASSWWVLPSRFLWQQYPTAPAKNEKLQLVEFFKNSTLTHAEFLALEGGRREGIDKGEEGRV